MSWISLTPSAIVSLAHPLLAGCLTVYFLTLKGKTRATWSLIAAFGFATAYFGAQTLVHTLLYPGASYTWRLLYVFVFPALVAMIDFAYAFPEPYRPKEARWVRRLGIVAAGVYAAFVVGGVALHGLDAPTLPSFVKQGGAAVLGGWAITVFARRARRPGPARKAHAAFAALLVLLPLAAGVVALGGYALFDEYLAGIVMSLVQMSFLAGFALVYINYVPRPTSFQVKLVGLSLFTVLAVLTVVTGVVFQNPWFERAADVDISPQRALRFEPVGPDAYRVRAVPFRAPPSGGEVLAAGAAGPVDLGLDFPLYGTSGLDAYVMPGAVSFGRPWEPDVFMDFFDDVPKLAPLFIGLGGYAVETVIHRGADGAAIVWTARLADEPAMPPIRLHVRLLGDGAFEFHYASGVRGLDMGLRGVHPGTLAAAEPGGPSAPAKPLSEQAEGTVLVEDFLYAARARTHARLVPLALSLFGAVAFIVLVFPLFFHVSLVRPLNRLLGGVQRVDEGDLGASVPVGVEDEIGRLTGHFNRMTGSLRRAHDELRDYADHLEDKVAERTAELAEKNAENERLLLNILPEPIADRLKESDEAIADAFADVTVLFADLVGFTGLSQRVSADRLVALLNDLFSRFDALAIELGVEKIKTIGDAYMAVCGLPEERPDHAETMARMALGMFSALEDFNAAQGTELQLRVGLNTGPVVAGVIGTHKFIYDLWGDAVNTAARMESHGVAGRVHVSASTAAQLGDAFGAESRGSIQVKGKGEMETYLLGTHVPTSIPETTA